eukprot:m.146345 g.146345  ORF g.146345 m.146345 type:complete len:748 (-) comp30472_c0_seq18:37-2280(-)
MTNFMTAMIQPFQTLIGSPRTFMCSSVITMLVSLTSLSMADPIPRSCHFISPASNDQLTYLPPHCVDDYEQHEVKCCADSKPQTGAWKRNSMCSVWATSNSFSSLNEPCQDEMNFIDASTLCASYGARLCTLAELAADCGKGSGCRHGKAYCWTIDTDGFQAPTPSPTPSPTQLPVSISQPTPSPTPHPTTSPNPSPTPFPLTTSPTASTLPSIPSPTPSPMSPIESTPLPTPSPTLSPTPSPAPSPTTPSPTASTTVLPTPSPTPSPATTALCHIKAPGASKHFDRLPPSCEHHNTLLNVRCCTHTLPATGSGWTNHATKPGCANVWAAGEKFSGKNEGCLTMMRFDDATEFCASVGSQLCSVEEHMNDCSTDTGCGIGKTYLWTRSIPIPTTPTIPSPTPSPTSPPTPAPQPPTVSAPTLSPTQSPIPAPISGWRAGSVIRSEHNPIIHKNLHTLGSNGIPLDNINGPSLILAPSWPGFSRLGKYYLYFGHHVGQQIRLAYSDHVNGPYTLWQPHNNDGVVHIRDTRFTGHIASPDVHVDTTAKKIYMIFHGIAGNAQVSFLAESTNGVSFVSLDVKLGPAYMRMFYYNNHWWGVARNNNDQKVWLHKASTSFIGSPYNQVKWVDFTSFGPGKVRHTAVHVRGDTLDIYYSTTGTTPEKISMASISMVESTWGEESIISEPQLHVLQTETDYEGVEKVIKTSKKGAGYGHELRDPYVFVDEDKFFLLYTGMGETNINVAQLVPAR